MVEIIQMKRADLEAVIEIEKASIPYSVVNVRFFGGAYENRRARYFVARQKAGGEVVGYVGIWLILDEGPYH